MFIHSYTHVEETNDIRLWGNGLHLLRLQQRLYADLAVCTGQCIGFKPEASNFWGGEAQKKV